MKVGKRSLSGMLAMGMLTGLLVSAQDDFDFDTLFEDLETENAPVAVTDESAESAPAESVVDAPAAVEADENDLDLEELFGDDTADADDLLEEAASPEVEEIAEPVADEAVIEEVLSDEVAIEEVLEDEAAIDDLLADDAAIDELLVDDAAIDELLVDDAGIDELLADDAGIEEVLAEDAPVENVIADDDFSDEIVADEALGEEESIEPSDEVVVDDATVEDEIVAESNEAADELSTAERVKRQAREIDGLKSLQAGYEFLTTEEYAKALESFTRSEANLPVRKENEEAINRAIWGQIEASYRISKNALDAGNTGEAKRFATAVLELDPVHRGAGRILSKVAKIEAKPVKEPRVKETKEYLDRVGSVDDLFNKGRENFEAKEYDTAEIYFERALLIDPYHINSMRFLKKISETKFDVASNELLATQAEMIRQVRDTWNPPIEGDVEIPGELERNQNTQTTVTDAALLEDKMQNIVIPLIEFRQANIQDVVNFLVEASIVGDTSGEGVNIILNLNLPNSGGGGGGFNAGGAADDPFSADGFADDPFGDPFGDPGSGDGGFDQAPASVGGGSDIPSITLNLRRVKLLDAIRYITEVANLKFRIESTAVIITPADAPVGRVITRVYPVLPSFLEVVVTRPTLDDGDRNGEFVGLGGRDTEIQSRGSGVKNFFIEAGIPFPQGTSITYNPSISSLIVANTQENIELFERLLPQFNIVPNQVEIEARFVEVAQSDIEQLGFEWSFTDDVELASRGNGPLATQERIQLDADLEGVSKGVRFFNLGSSGLEAGSKGAATALNPLGDILSFSSILTNPEMNLIIHALDQNGNADVLSAPRVTTRSGVNAQMEVVEEIIYPTEFETNVSTIRAQTEGGTSSDQQVVTITPGSFETREVGVILNVTPTVGPDGYTIELVMAPEVAELTDWLDYGGTQDGVSYRIPQPVFSSRNLTTSIVIWDGQTVVMGGLISERLTTINDKIPILGDIPLIGRFFQNKGEASEKRNLLIFVTARVVDPSGKPIRRAGPQDGAAVSP